MSATVSRTEAAEGTCVPLTESPRVWAVRGRNAWYRCDADRLTCSCCHYLYRLAATNSPCRHVRMLTDYLMTAETVRLQMTARRDDAPLPTDAELRRIFS